MNIKRMLLILIFILFTSEAMAEPWSKEDKILLGTAMALSVVDTMQTLQFEKYGIEEANPILKPFVNDPGAFIAAMALTRILEFIILDRFPETREILKYQVGFHLSVVISNREKLRTYGGGIKIPF